MDDRNMWQEWKKTVSHYRLSSIICEDDVIWVEPKQRWNDQQHLQDRNRSYWTQTVPLHDDDDDDDDDDDETNSHGYTKRGRSHAIKQRTTNWITEIFKDTRQH